MDSFLSEQATVIISYRYFSFEGGDKGPRATEQLAILHQHVLLLVSHHSCEPQANCTLTCFTVLTSHLPQAIPYFLIFMALEAVILFFQGKTFRINDAIGSMSQGLFMTMSK